jgi:hypothetical protein
MLKCLIVMFVMMGCHERMETKIDAILPLNNQLAIENDSLQKVKPLVLKYANLYINDMNNKEKKDLMEYWSSVQQRLHDRIAAIKFSIDSLERKRKTG